jgi:hypothetical protein
VRCQGGEDLNFAIAVNDVEVKLLFRRRQKGDGIYISGHETLGILVDELQEYRDEVHAKSDAKRKRQELIDIAVGALWGIASIDSGKQDW